MTDDPLVSFVAGSRNDDHGGNLGHRMQVFIEALLAQCDRHGLDAELVLVEWNPPPDRPRLAEALDWPGSGRCKVRIIEVPPFLHQRFDNADALPLHQMIAKNVGIRRARGRFVAVTNVDILFSDSLVDFLARGDLETDCFYRTERHDVSAAVPAGVPVERQLAFCRENLLRIHRREGSRDLTTNQFKRIYRSPALLKALSWLSPLAIVPMFREPLLNAKRSYRLYRECGFLNTNACGDFTMMAGERWKQLHGYREFTGFPVHIDGLLCYSAHFSGLKERMVPGSACVYHIEHGQGSGFSGYVSGEKWRDLDEGGVPRITSEEYLATLFGMKAGREALIANGDDWGLGDAELLELSPMPAE